LKQSGNAEITFCLETSGAHVSRRQGEELIKGLHSEPVGWPLQRGFLAPASSADH
jgi:hypothetical protein